MKYHNIHMKHKAIIICGSSRAGKTTLAKLTNLHSQSHKGLVFEGLFPAYLSRLSYVLKRVHPMLFKEYMERPRYIDEKKSKTLTPQEQLEDCNFSKSVHFLDSIYNSFGESWAIADLHAELYYKELLRASSDVHFCVAIRDPRECVCAGLYWLDFPNAIKNRKLWFYKNLFSWILSAHVAKVIQSKYPANITIVNLNKIKSGEAKKIQSLLGLKDGWDSGLPDNFYFSFIENGKFTTPKNNEYQELLTVKERAIIQALCADIMLEYGYKSEDIEGINIPHIRLIKKMMIGLAIFSPSLARGLINLLFSPLQHVKNQFNRFKQLIKDIRNF